MTLLSWETLDNPHKLQVHLHSSWQKSHNIMSEGRWPQNLKPACNQRAELTENKPECCTDWRPHLGRRQFNFKPISSLKAEERRGCLQMQETVAIAFSFSISAYSSSPKAATICALRFSFRNQIFSSQDSRDVISTPPNNRTWGGDTE